MIRYIRMALLAATLTGTWVSAAEREENPLVIWSGQSLSVSAHRVPLRALLETVAARSGLEIRGLQYVQGEISAQFAAQPLQAALKTLLARASYTLLERPNPDRHGPKLVTVDILAGPSAMPTVVAAEPEQVPDGGDRDTLREQALGANAMTRNRAWQRLATQSPQVALDLASAAMTSTDVVRRAEAAQVLSTLAQPQATALLEHALADKDSNVRRVALMSLAMRPATDSLPYLLAALRDPAVEVSNLARTLLAQKGGRY